MYSNAGIMVSSTSLLEMDKANFDKKYSHKFVLISLLLVKYAILCFLRAAPSELR